MDDPDLEEAARVRRTQILVDDRGDVAGQEGMEIEAVLDRQLDGVVAAQPPTAAGRPSRAAA
ncbi:MAG TPA: hypothetical protein VF010_02860, partial [Methylomirabilota bacterium]|nr:hypothetical protein [Methylomirabilota bacterium]